MSAGVRQIQIQTGMVSDDIVDAGYGHDKTQVLIGLVNGFWHNWLRKM